MHNCFLRRSKSCMLASAIQPAALHALYQELAIPWHRVSPLYLLVEPSPYTVDPPPHRSQGQIPKYSLTDMRAPASRTDAASPPSTCTGAEAQHLHPVWRGAEKLHRLQVCTVGGTLLGTGRSGADGNDKLAALQTAAACSCGVLAGHAMRHVATSCVNVQAACCMHVDRPLRPLPNEKMPFVT